MPIAQNPDTGEYFELKNNRWEKIDAPVAKNPETGETFRLEGEEWKSIGVDRQTGAPIAVRATVGPSYRNPDDRLATIRKYYPDAEPFENGNFIFTDTNGKKRLFNPEGIDVGDLAEYGRIIPEMIGGAAGGVMGAAASTPTGMTSAPVMVPVGVGLGAEMGGAAYDAVMENMMGRQDTRDLIDRAIDTTAGVTLNAAGQKLVPAAIDAVKGLAGAARNRLAGETPQSLISSYNKAGVPIEGASAFINASRPVQGMANALTNMPTSARIMGEAIDETMSAMNRYADNVARMAGTPGTQQQAGQMIKDGIGKAGKRLQTRLDELQGRVWATVGRDTPVPVDNVQGLVDAMKMEMARAPNSLGYLRPAIKEGEKLLKDAETTGTIPFDVLRKFRTHVGKLTERSDIAGYVGGEAGQVNRLYGALSDDLNEAAKAAGPDAARSLDLYNRYARIQLSGNKPFLEKVDKQFPEQIIGTLMSGGKKGSTVIRQMRNNLLPEEWDDVVATVVQRMGLATPGVQNQAGDLFSPDVFLTNWNRMTPEAKAALFDGRRYKELRLALDRLSRIAASAKDARQMQNFSGTAQANVYMQIAQGGLPVLGYMAGDLQGAAVGAAASYGGPYAMARLMTNPKFVRWLARGYQIEPTNYNGLTAHIGRLAVIAKAEPEIKGEIYQYLAAMREAFPAVQEVSSEKEVPRTE